MSTKHIMVDIETISTRQDAAVLSIGAVVFSLDKDAPVAGTVEGDSMLVSVDQGFYTELDENSEYHVDPKTVAWWGTQGQAAQEALSINKVVVPCEALDALGDFFQHHNFVKTYTLDGDRVWANPAQFDFTILRHMASVERTSENDVPWHHRQETCMRTAFWMYRDAPVLVEDKTLVAHRADHDAIKQARALQRFFAE